MARSKPAGAAENAGGTGRSLHGCVLSALRLLGLAATILLMSSLRIQAEDLFWTLPAGQSDDGPTR